MAQAMSAVTISAKQFRVVRAILEMDQKQLAGLLGLTRSQIKNWEDGADRCLGQQAVKIRERLSEEGITLVGRGIPSPTGGEGARWS